MKSIILLSLFVMSCQGAFAKTSKSTKFEPIYTIENGDVDCRNPDETVTFKTGDMEYKFCFWCSAKLSRDSEDQFVIIRFLKKSGKATVDATFTRNRIASDDKCRKQTSSDTVDLIPILFK